MTGSMFPTGRAFDASISSDVLQETELKSSFDLEAVLKRHAGKAQQDHVAGQYMEKLPLSYACTCQTCLNRFLPGKFEGSNHTRIVDECRGRICILAV